MTKRKGIVLAGGNGTRLYPLTVGVSKQLLPVYDKPMIYYPLTVMMLAGIKEILIISGPDDLSQYKRVLEDGSQWGIKLSYKCQPNPDGLAQGFHTCRKLSQWRTLGTNTRRQHLFWPRTTKTIAAANVKSTGATVFGYHVNNPERYGVVGFDTTGKVNSITEKPTHPASNYAVTGLYFVDSTAPERGKKIKPSARGELEITSLLKSYLIEDSLTVEKLGRGFAWLDTGTHGSLLDAGNFVRTLIERQGLQVGSPDEVAYNMKWIKKDQILKRAQAFGKSKYGQYLRALK